MSWGRHDICLAPRAVPVVEAMMACCLADHAMRAGLIPSGKFRPRFIIPVLSGDPFSPVRRYRMWVG